MTKTNVVVSQLLDTGMNDYFAFKYPATASLQGVFEGIPRSAAFFDVDSWKIHAPYVDGLVTKFEGLGAKVIKQYKGSAISVAETVKEYDILYIAKAKWHGDRYSGSGRKQQQTVYDQEGSSWCYIKDKRGGHGFALLLAVPIMKSFFSNAPVEKVAMPPLSGAMSYYEILGVPETATQADIKKAFSKRAIKYHPDHNKSLSADTDMRLITQARDSLSDPNKRALYDAMRHDLPTVDDVAADPAIGKARPEFPDYKPPVLGGYFKMGVIPLRGGQNLSYEGEIELVTSIKEYEPVIENGLTRKSRWDSDAGTPVYWFE